MDCTVCNGRGEVYSPPQELEQDPGGWEPCGHCDSTGVEPPPEGHELTKAEILVLRRETSRNMAAPANSPPNVARLYR